ERCGHIVPVSLALLDRPCGRQSLSRFIEEPPGQQAWCLAVNAARPLDTVLGEQGLYSVPERLIYNFRMLAWIGIALVRCFTAIGPVLKQKIKGALRETLIAVLGAVGPDATLASDACDVEFHLKRPDRLEP